MPPDRNRQLARVGMLVALLAFWLVELSHLAVVPRAYEDEPWIASTSWKLATTGMFASDIQGNFYGSASHYFGFMPLYPLLQSLVFRAGGLGLWQARLTSVYLGLLVCALTFALGRRLFGAPVGLLAIAGLMLTRTAGLTLYRPTGILLIDFARLARYDIAVPVFGLAACLALGRAGPSAGRWAGWWAALAGGLGGLAGLAHVYGWFWLAALGAALLHMGARWLAWRWAAGTLMALSLGAAVVTLPYGGYVLAHWGDWLGQTAEYGDRARVLNITWYANNVLREVQRYGPGLGEPNWQAWLRPGLWLAWSAGPAAGVMLMRRAGRNLQASAYAWSLAALPVLLAVFITSKVANYLLLYLPLAALAIAWGVVALWRAARARRWRWLQSLVVLACAAVVLEGAGQWRGLDQTATATTPFNRYVQQVRAIVDQSAFSAGPAVLGLHTYWFGFSDLSFTSWYYPVVLARSRLPGRAVPLATTLERLAPDFALVDARTRDFLDAAEAGDPEAATITAWLAAGFVWVGAVEDATYGRTDVYRRRAAAYAP
jgi:hypothetical protein